MTKLKTKTILILCILPLLVCGCLANDNVYYKKAETKYNSGKYEDAIINAEKVIKLDPNNAEYYWLRGSVKFKLGQYEKAMNDFNSALKLNPDEAAKLILGFARTAIDDNNYEPARVYVETILNNYSISTTHKSTARELSKKL